MRWIGRRVVLAAGDPKHRWGREATARRRSGVPGRLGPWEVVEKVRARVTELGLTSI